MGRHAHNAAEGCLRVTAFVTNVDYVAVRGSVVKAIHTSGYDYLAPVKQPSTGNSSARCRPCSAVCSDHTI